MGKITATFNLDCGCCGGGEVTVEWSCRSLTGTGVLCGFSGFDNGTYADDPDHWEGRVRKWQTVSLSGDMSSTSWGGTGCTEPAACYGAPGSGGFGDQQVVWAGAATLTCEGRVDMQPTVTGVFNYSCDTSVSTPNAYTISQNIPESAALYSPVATLEERTWTGPGCIEDTRPFIDRASFDLQGTATETLEDEVFFIDVLQALLDGGSEDVEEGDSCCAHTESATATSPMDQGPMTIAGTAAEVQILVGGACSPPGALYSITIEFERVVDGDVQTLTVSTAAPCNIPATYPVPQPAPGDPDWCAVSVIVGDPL